MKPTIRAILRETGEHYGIRVADLVSHRKDRTVIRPRQVAIYLARMLTTHTLPVIGRHVGGRDHTTVIHAIGRVEADLAADPEFGGDIKAIVERLGGVDDPAAEVDPAVIAVDLAMGVRAATDVSVEQIVALARLTVAWGRRLGVIIVEGEADPNPDPEIAPIEVEVAPRLLLAAVDRALRAADTIATRRYSAGEGAALTDLLTALRGLREARSTTR